MRNLSTELTGRSLSTRMSTRTVRLATAPAPAPAPAEVPDPFFIVNPIDFGLFAARVTSITGPATFRCDDPTEQRVAVRVRWTSVNTAFVDVLIDGIGFDAGGRPNGSTWVILDCGSDHVVTARARAADNSHGLSMSTTIAYEAP